MRRFIILLITLALSLSGLVFNSAKAAVPADGGYSCATGEPASTGSRYQIITGIVLQGGTCSGDVVINADVIGIGDYAFLQSSMRTINIPAGVKSIGSGAFQDTTALASITIPEGITSIADSTFAGASALASITMPASVTNIADNAFSRATALASITIPDNVTSIGSSAFSGATALTSITIPEKVTIIGSSAFVGATGLTAITVVSGNETFTSVDGVLLNKNVTTLIQYPAGKTANSYNIPNTVTTIGNSAFRGATSLTSVTIPTSVTSIGTSAFQSATALTAITIPTSVTSIGNSVFQNATALTAITIPTSVTSIGASAFFGATALSSITIPTSVTSIGVSAFQNATSLTSVTIPTGVTRISDYAFSGATSLTSVTIPTSVTRISDYAFKDATSLTSVTIPTSVTSIGIGAFRGASRLKDIYFMGNAPGLVGSSAFSNIDTSAKANIRSSASNFGTPGSLWNGLEVAVGVYAVSFNANDGSTVTTRDYLGLVTAPTPPTRAGYTFSGWSEIDGGSTPVTFPISTSSDATLHGIWTPNTYAVSIDSKGGTQVPALSFTTGGAIASAPADPTRNCSTFAGWSATDGGPAVSFPYSPGVIADITLYAKWAVIPCAGTPGATPNSKVVSVPVGVSEATIPATNALPAIKLNLSGATGQAVVTVAPISNPDPSNSPFKAGDSAKIVDINVSGITGKVTICLDGGSDESLFHFTAGAWVVLPERSYVNGQVCGVTSSFSPFTSAIPAKTPKEEARIVAAAAAEVKAAAAEVKAAAADLKARTFSSRKSYGPHTLAKQVGVKVRSPKAKVTMKVASSSKKNCAVVAGKLKTLKAGKCFLTFTVQEPKPKKGKQPKATKTSKTLVVK